MIQTVWAQLLLASLRRAGVTDAVISPGSRSTPFAAAALAAGLRCTPVTDERAASFFALGQARVSGRPSLLICTSGTAGAHYYPAVIEASHAGVPLIALTADRPPELQGCGAPQTIDQTRLYGDHVRGYFDLGIAEASEPTLRALHRRAIQAYGLAAGPPPGPVQINAPARKPLEPVTPAKIDRSLAALSDRLLATSPAAPVTRSVAPSSMITALANHCREHRRGVIVAGPLSLRHTRLRQLVADLAAATDYPLLAEATSQLRFTNITRAAVCDGFDLFLRSRRIGRWLRPELVIRIGAPPTSRALNDYLADCRGAVQLLLTEGDWPDPDGTATTIAAGALDDTLTRLLAELPRPAAGGDWSARFARADRSTRAAVEVALGRGDGAMSQGAATRATVAAVPPGSLLAVGNSMPVRDLDCFCPAAIARVDLISQRGVNGIDGLIAGAAGAASLGDRPLLLLVGDVAFAHDLGGLAAAAGAVAPLVIVVVDNRGGRIFDRLPIARSPVAAGDLERFWLTPPGCDIRAAAAVYDHRYAEASTAGELAAAIARGLARPGCTVIRAIVEAAGSSAREAAITAAVERELEELLPTPTTDGGAT